MKTLTQLEATQTLDGMLAIQQGASGNEARKLYKNEFRGIIARCMTDDDKANVKAKCGFTVNRMTDMVHWPVLCNVILFAVGEVLRPSEGYTANAAFSRLVLAWCDDSKCRPAARGTGVSRGYHTAMLGEDEVLAALRWMKNEHSTQDLGHAAYLLGRVLWGVEHNKMHPTQTQHEQEEMYYIAVSNIDTDCWDDWPQAFRKAVTMVSDYSGATTSSVSCVTETLLLRMDTGSDDLNYETADEDIKSLVTAVMTGKTKPVVAQPVAPLEPEVEAEEVDDDDFQSFNEPKPLDPALAPAVDALIQQASAGATRGVTDYVDNFREVNKAYQEAVAEIKRQRRAIAKMPCAGHTGEAEVDGSTLTYEVVMRKASDLFTDAHGRKSSKLGFEIRTLVWRDEDGNVVHHPNCPEVDDTYKFRMHHLIKYLTAKHFGQHVWMHGHTGTGKTSFVEQVEARLGFPMERLNLDSNMERADIVGSVDIVVKDGAPMSKFTEGMLPRAMQQPVVFLLDEVDAGRPDMLFVLQRALENKGLTLTEDGGRLVTPHPLFMFAGTANSRGQGDEHGWYQGVRPMNLAFLNRFGAFIEVGYMDEDDERQFLKDAYPKLDKRMADQFAAFAQMVRSSFMNGELSQTVSPRNLHAMAQYYQHYTAFMSHEEAWTEVVETCVSDAAPADNQQRIVELSRTVFGGGL